MPHCVAEQKPIPAPRRLPELHEFPYDTPPPTAGPPGKFQDGAEPIYVNTRHKKSADGDSSQGGDHPTIHRVPSDYDFPPPQPQPKTTPPKLHPAPAKSSVESKSSKVEVPLPVRMDRLKENQEVNIANKENDSRPRQAQDRYIEQLVADGYERVEVVRALSISGNNLRMARDILREFGRKK